MASGKPAEAGAASAQGAGPWPTLVAHCPVERFGGTRIPVVSGVLLGIPTLKAHALPFVQGWLGNRREISFFLGGIKTFELHIWKNIKK